MASPDVEDILQAVINVFEANFPAALAAVDAAKATQLNPFPPENYIFGDEVNMPTMPALLFTADKTAPQQEEYGWRRQAYDLQIEAYYTDQDIQTLERIIMRYGAAIDNVLRANMTLGMPANVRAIVNIAQAYSQPAATNGSLMQGVAVTFTVVLNTN